MRLIGWTSRGLDGVSKDLELVTSRIKSTMTPNSIILAHEGTGIAQDVVAAILDHAQKQGWTFIDPLADE